MIHLYDSIDRNPLFRWHWIKDFHWDRLPAPDKGLKRAFGITVVWYGTWRFTLFEFYHQLITQYTQWKVRVRLRRCLIYPEPSLVVQVIFPAEHFIGLNLTNRQSVKFVSISSLFAFWSNRVDRALLYVINSLLWGVAWESKLSVYIVNSPEPKIP